MASSQRTAFILPPRRLPAGKPRSVGAALLAGIGTNATLLWFLLPLAVFLAGVAPACISFAGGQAAFTLTVVILFSILQPAGWRLGLVRIEDVALGVGVSLVVGVLFWPRGAAAALRQALAQAYADGQRHRGPDDLDRRSP